MEVFRTLLSNRQCSFRNLQLFLVRRSFLFVTFEKYLGEIGFESCGGLILLSVRWFPFVECTGSH